MVGLRTGPSPKIAGRTRSESQEKRIPYPPIVCHHIDIGGLFRPCCRHVAFRWAAVECHLSRARSNGM